MANRQDVIDECAKAAFDAAREGESPGAMIGAIVELKRWRGWCFPLANTTLRKEAVRCGHCPECGDDLDTGWECTGCGYDARSIARP